MRAPLNLFVIYHLFQPLYFIFLIRTRIFFQRNQQTSLACTLVDENAKPYHAFLKAKTSFILIIKEFSDTICYNCHHNLSLYHVRCLSTLLYKQDPATEFTNSDLLHSKMAPLWRQNQLIRFPFKEAAPPPLNARSSIPDPD